MDRWSYINLSFEDLCAVVIKINDVFTMYNFNVYVKPEINCKSYKIGPLGY